MDNLEKIIHERVSGSNPLLPGISLGASSFKGEFEYTQVFGPLSSSPNSGSLKNDDVFWIASCTKLLTTICMLQCVEKGLFSLDQDISTVLPEWKDAKILTGFSEGKPVLKKAKNKITIRHLLTHSAGLPGLRPDSLVSQYQQWLRFPPRTAQTTVEAQLPTVLIYEPGEGWEYSTGLDWAGKMIERVTKQSLSEYMSTHVLAPLSMTSTTFRQSEIICRLVPTTERLVSQPISGTDGKLVPGISAWFDGVKEDFGGGGAYSNVSDYMKVLRSILRIDGMLLGKRMVKEMFKPHLTPKSHTALNTALNSPRFSSPSYASITGNNKFFITKNSPKIKVETDWGLGGLLLMEDLPCGRKKGSLSWSGLPNLYWWIDPTSGICGTYATQILPPGDPESAKMNSEFEKAVYQELSWSSWIRS